MASTFLKTPGWMTPVELFSPYLSRAIANRIQRTAPDNGPLNVIEIGAGRGTLATDILRYWGDHPDLMERVNYVTVEISEVLAKIQKESLQEWILKGKAEVCNMNALEWFCPERLDLEGHCHVIATEVLDNMGHDLVRQGETLEQAEIHTSEDGLRSVQWSECTDNTILTTLGAYGVLDYAHSQQNWLSALRERFEHMLGENPNIWVPTASFLLLRAITSALPQAHLTITDFHSFPGALPGVNAPVVQSVRGGAAIVYDEVHSAPFGKADIMFPTDFHSLACGHESMMRDETQVSRLILKQSNFFQLFSSKEDVEASTCLDGYNPILHDFQNVSYFLVDFNAKPS